MGEVKTETYAVMCPKCNRENEGVEKGYYWQLEETANVRCKWCGHRFVASHPNNGDFKPGYVYAYPKCARM